jgi:hypothetical protein
LLVAVSKLFRRGVFVGVKPYIFEKPLASGVAMAYLEMVLPRNSFEEKQF